jgi:hypothetical protein
MSHRLFPILFVFFLASCAEAFAQKVERRGGDLFEVNRDAQVAKLTTCNCYLWLSDPKATNERVRFATIRVSLPDFTRNANLLLNRPLVYEVWSFSRGGWSVVHRRTYEIKQAFAAQVQVVKAFYVADESKLVLLMTFSATSAWLHILNMLDGTATSVAAVQDARRLSRETEVGGKPKTEDALIALFRVWGKGSSDNAIQYRWCHLSLDGRLLEEIGESWPEIKKWADSKHLRIPEEKDW